MEVRENVLKWRDGRIIQSFISQVAIKITNVVVSHMFNVFIHFGARLARDARVNLNGLFAEGDDFLQ